MKKKNSVVWKKWEAIAYLLKRYPTLNEDFSLTRKRVFEVVRENPDDSLEALAQKLNMSSSNVASHIGSAYRHFVKKGLID